MELSGCGKIFRFYLRDWVVHQKRLITVFDFYHVTEHLSSFAEAAFEKDSEKKAWFKKACKQLKQGKSSELIQAMISLKKEAKMTKDSLTSEINHLVKLEKAERINYHLIADKKFPLGSGAIESLIRQAVNLRLKGNGK